MKKYLFITGLLCISSFASFINAQSSLVPELFYFKFNGTGTRVPNLALTPPAGTDTATIMGFQTQGGASGECGTGSLIGTGNTSSSDYVNTNWVTNLDGMSWTISFWTNNIPNTTSTYYILGDVNASNFRVFTGGVANPGNWMLRGAFFDVPVPGGAAPTPAMTTLVYDMPINEMRAYVNGTLVTTITQGGVSINGAGPFKVGGQSSSAGLPSGSFLDEFRMYNRALTQQEITDLYLMTHRSSVTLNACESMTSPSGLYTWNTDGVYNDTITNSMGCGDSIITANLTILHHSTNTITPTACASYTAPSGTVLTSSGTYNDTIPNFVGCDSVITINLTVNYPSSQTLNEVVCGSYTSPGGNVYSLSGTYMDTIPNFLGCDSVLTINLTVNYPSADTINPFACDNYTAPSGAVFSVSGTYMDTIPNFVGCDSVITINLSLENNSTSSITTSICTPTYTAPSGAVYSVTGTYNDTIPNMAGCDSVITINLTIDLANTSVNQSGSSGENLSTVGTGTYQWIDCSTMLPVSGATNATFVASSNGSYAVIVDNGSCIDTSSCFIVAGLGVDYNTLAELAKLYPNPTKGQFYVSVGPNEATFTLELINNVGQVLQSTLFTNSNIGIMEINGTSGLYFIRITKSNGEKVVLRVIKD